VVDDFVERSAGLMVSGSMYAFWKSRLHALFELRQLRGPLSLGNSRILE